MDEVHINGRLKKETVDNMDKYVHRDDRLPTLLDRMKEHGETAMCIVRL